MALVECTECKGSVSSDALTCPHCGIAAPAMSQGQKEQIIAGAKFAQLHILAGVLFFGGIAWLALLAMSGAGRDAFILAFSFAKWLIGGGTILYIFTEIKRNLVVRRMKKKR